MTKDHVTKTVFLADPDVATNASIVLLVPRRYEYKAFTPIDLSREGSQHRYMHLCSWTVQSVLWPARNCHIE